MGDKRVTVFRGDARFRDEMDSLFPSDLPPSLDDVERKPRPDVKNRKLPPTLSMIEKTVRENANKASFQEKSQEALGEAVKQTSNRDGKADSGGESEMLVKKETEFFKAKFGAMCCWKAHSK